MPAECIVSMQPGKVGAELLFILIFVFPCARDSCAYDR